MSETSSPPTIAAFGPRLRLAMDTHAPLCAGIDPHRSVVEAWGLPYTARGLERFAMTCVQAFAGRVACVKPQSAFFEVFGSAGVAVLERVLAGLRDSGTLSILDVKRGDLRSTMDAYAAAYLGEDSALRADAVTLSPFLGYESLRPALDLAARTGRGVFVLALTSNPEGAQVQHALLGGRSVAASVVEGAARDNAAAGARDELGSVGLVVGATLGAAPGRLGLDLAAANAPILAPGIGAQRASTSDLAGVFGAALGNVVASTSRDLLLAGPDPDALARAATDTAARLRDTLLGSPREGPRDGLGGGHRRP